MKFSTLKMVGFQSQAEYKVFKLDQPGLNVITGRNGVGKSTIFNALAWCLYGKTLKERATVETWEHLRPPGYSGTMVTVSLIKGGHKYRVTRCKGYKETIRGAAGRDRLIFEKDSEIFPKNIKDKRDIQTAITEVLGMSFALFTNTIIFPQRVTRFIEEKGAVKKKILEESFSLTWLTKMLDLAKNKRSDMGVLVSKKESEVKGLQSTIQDLNELISKAQESIDKQKQEKQQAIKKTKEDIAKLEAIAGKQINKYTQLENHIKEDEEELRSTTMEEAYSFYSKNLVKQSEIINSLKAIRKEIADYEVHLTAIRKGGKCSACGQTLPKKDLDKQRRSYRLKLAAAKEKEASKVKASLKIAAKVAAGKILQEQADALEASLLEDRAEWKAKEADRLAVEGSKGRLQELRIKLKELEARKINDLTPTLRQKREIASISLRKQFDILKKYQRKWNLLDWAITTPLSNSGIKAFLFDILLEALNNRIAYYERFTNIGVVLEINMNSARKDIDTVVTKNGYPVAYHDLSGGESQLVNTIMALAQNDILTKENPSNLSVLDEVFEGMDDEATELVGGLLQELAKDKSVFVITHSNNFNPHNANLIRM